MGAAGAGARGAGGAVRVLQQRLGGLRRAKRASAAPFGGTGGDMDADIRWALTETRTWAVVGCSPDPSRDSHRIAALLQARGFRVIPINPSAEVILGERCYPSLAAIPPTETIDVVDVFRRSDAAGEHVDEAIAIGARGVWLQLGAIGEEAVARAREAGMRAVMDRCPAIELPRLDAVA